MATLTRHTKESEWSHARTPQGFTLYSTGRSRAVSEGTVMEFNNLALMNHTNIQRKVWVVDYIISWVELFNHDW